MRSNKKTSRPSSIVVRDSDCCAVGPGFEFRGRHGCLLMYSAIAALNSRRAASPIERLVKVRREVGGVLSPPGYSIELNHTATCMVFKATANDRHTFNPLP
ncbi:hypothetical protein TNCV_5124351 [Trichonephila clavipes]|nr:hypothetical protein TNCV_5124351 [Trichonephila clavipes]